MIINIKIYGLNWLLTLHETSQSGHDDDRGIDTRLTWEFDRRIWSLGLIWFDCWVSWCLIESNISWIKSKRRRLLTKSINDEYGQQSQIAARARWWSVTTILKLLLDQKNNDWILFLFLIFDFLFSSFHFLFFDFIFFFFTFLSLLSFLVFFPFLFFSGNWNSK